MSRTNRKQVKIRVVGQRRKEPDVRRLAKAIIRLSLDADTATESLLDLEAVERARSRTRKAPAKTVGEADQTDREAS